MSQTPVMADAKKSRNFYENKPYTDEPRKFQDGERVEVGGHSQIWQKYCGEVAGFQHGLHHVRIDTKPSGIKCGPFSVEIPGSDLEAAL